MLDKCVRSENEIFKINHRILSFEKIEHTMDKIMLISGEVIRALIALVSMCLSFVLFYCFRFCKLLCTYVTD